MATRFERRGAPDARVGEILSDSNSDVSSLDNSDIERSRGPVENPPPKKGDVLSASDNDDDDDDRGNSSEAVSIGPKVHQRPTPLHAIKRKNSKWYDSDDDDEWDHVASDGDKEKAERTRSRSGPTVKAEAPPPPPPQAPVTNPEPKQAPPPAVLSPEAAAPTITKQPPEKRSSFAQRLVGKTFNLSPFGSKRKGLENATSPASSGPDTPRTGGNNAATTTTTTPKPVVDPVARMRSPLSDVSSIGDAPVSDRRVGLQGLGRKRSHDPNGVLSDQTNGSDVASPQSFRNSPEATEGGSRRLGGDGTPSAIRRGSELPANEALSPGQRRVPGAFPGRPDSGVLLEGWLRQKQRRGVKGMKKWNSRYFVLYAKTNEAKWNEVRYYADVVQSAWGPIPLGEIGSISLRLIQRIGKPGTLKYKGCRLDITCRNTWGTHYADDYVSSDDENANNNNSNHDGAARSADRSTPKSSRVYSLMADSPQTAAVWFTTLDSLLIRSANSPRVDVGAPSSGSNKQLKRTGSGGGTKMMTRRRTNTLDADAMVLCGPNDHVPKPVLYAINLIFDSSPGIETEKFYETEPDAGRLKAALKFLNQFATDATRKPTKDELEQALDPVTAGAVVKLWLAQLETPLVPFELYDDFRALAADAKAAPFELARNLQALVRALPPRHYGMLACVLFHLNDVNVYASKNGMDAGVLAALFGEFIVRPRTVSNNQDDAESERLLLRVVVEEMIAHVDAIIDEKEAEILDRV